MAAMPGEPLNPQAMMRRRASSSEMDGGCFAQAPFFAAPFFAPAAFPAFFLLAMAPRASFRFESSSPRSVSLC